MWLNILCEEDGLTVEQVERDNACFKWGYEREYKKRTDHLVLPVTYRCNLKCKYCYTLSNSTMPLPKDRTVDRLARIAADFGGNISLIGGEPTVREDLTELIGAIKSESKTSRVSVCTNGQRLRDIDYVKGLRESGLDFVFLSVNDITYDGPVVYRNKLEALENCRKLRLPVWFHLTIDNVDQLDFVSGILDVFGDIIFKVTVRSAKSFGITHPIQDVFLSDMLKHLNKEDEYTQGWNPSNRNIRLSGKTVNICSWINDATRLDPVDSSYFVSNDALTTFHRGKYIDELLIRGQNTVSAGRA